ncbi:uncharacterized protein LOC131150407 [Malania oleifera]|uniref:uncharacterized protein LOC131150407 n=1 Tax=Malania oleifera TaxID=397392 RepID=UPI0025AE6B5E|nr:uncharacterized protein LOC131150407 [Malania oleifera]
MGCIRKIRRVLGDGSLFIGWILNSQKGGQRTAKRAQRKPRLSIHTSSRALLHSKNGAPPRTRRPPSPQTHSGKPAAATCCEPFPRRPCCWRREPPTQQLSSCGEVPNRSSACSCSWRDPTVPHAQLRQLPSAPVTDNPKTPLPLQSSAIAATQAPLARTPANAPQSPATQAPSARTPANAPRSPASREHQQDPDHRLPPPVSATPP